MLVDFCSGKIYNASIMKSWKVTSAEKVELMSDASETTGTNQVKIKINECDLSHSDIEVYNGHIVTDFPRIIGKICAGMVTEVGEGVTEFVRGDRVVTMPFKFCDNCAACKDGRHSACENIKLRGVSVNGFMRDFAVVDASDVYKLPDRIKDSEAVFLDCLSVAITVMNTLQINKGEHIVITDAGVVGQLLGQVALYCQAIPIIIDMKEKYLENASAHGIYYTIDSVKSDPYKKIFNLTGGKMAETVALISGNPAVLPQAFKFAGTGGRVALINKYGLNVDMTCNLAPVLKNGLTVYGINNSRKTLSMAINMLANRAVSTDGLIDSEIPFEGVGAFIEAAKGKMSEYQKYIAKMA